MDRERKKKPSLIIFRENGEKIVKGRERDSEKESSELRFSVTFKAKVRL